MSSLPLALGALRRGDLLMLLATGEAASRRGGDRLPAGEADLESTERLREVPFFLGGLLLLEPEDREYERVLLLPRRGGERDLDSDRDGLVCCARLPLGGLNDLFRARCESPLGLGLRDLLLL